MPVVLERLVMGALFGFVAMESLAAPIAMTDATGARVALSAPAERIVSLAPHATELLFAAGAGAHVVGVLAPADWPPEAKRVPRVGDATGVDLERIVALKPDLVVVWPYLAPAAVQRLREVGVPVFVSDPQTPEAIAADLERLGALVGVPATASAVAASFRSRLKALERRERGVAIVSVFYEIWPRPLYTVGGRHLISAALAICGARNVFADLSLPAPVVGIEDVLAARPDAIVAGTDGAVRPEWLDEWRRWRELPAVAHQNLLVVDANLLHRAGPRFVEGAEELCAALDGARINLRRF